MATLINNAGVQHYANKMVLAENRKVGSKSLPTALADIDNLIDEMKTQFDAEYGSALDMKLENNENVFSVGTGTNVDKRSEVENSFTDVELSGNSLVNLCPPIKSGMISFNTNSEGINTSGYYKGFKMSNLNIKIGQTYTSILLGTNNIRAHLWNNIGIQINGTFGKFIATEMVSDSYLHFYPEDGNLKESDLTNLKVILLEGDWTNKPIPQYFEGMKSVGEKEDGNHKISISSVGKNLFDFRIPIENILTYSNGFPFERDKKITLNSNYKLLDNGFYVKTSSDFNNEGLGFYVKCKQNTNYSFCCDVKFSGSYTIKCQGVYKNEIPIKTPIKEQSRYMINNENISTAKFSKTFNSKNYDYLFFYLGGSWVNNPTTSKEIEFTNIQLEDSLTSTSYEPYKEDKKEISLNEPLRGLPNGVRDTIELIDGRWKLVRRCGEVVLDGNRTWTIWSNNTDGQNLTYNAHVYSADLDITKKTTSDSNLNVINDKVTNHYRSFIDRTGESIIVASSILHLSILRTKLETQDTTGLKKWLSQNPIKVVYELATPIIEDISPVTLQCWKNGTISIDEVLPIETTHTVALNKPAQIKRNIEELTTLRKRVQALEDFYDKVALEQSHQLSLISNSIELDYDI